MSIALTQRRESHALQLVLRLLDLGIIERGKFTFLHFLHDGDCEALASGLALDCRCDPELIIDGHKYSYSEIVGNGRAQ